MNRLRLTQGLAVAGTILAWIPIAAPFVFMVARLARGGGFGMDYLMPAELSPLAALGGGLLLAAAILARRRVKWIAWGLGAAVLLLVGGQVLAVVSGLARGDAKPEGLSWVLVIASIAGYTLAVIALGVGGVLLARDLFRREK